MILLLCRRTAVILGHFAADNVFVLFKLVAVFVFPRYGVLVLVGADERALR